MTQGEDRQLLRGIKAAGWSELSAQKSLISWEVQVGYFQTLREMDDEYSPNFSVGVLMS